MAQKIQPIRLRGRWVMIRAPTTGKETPRTAFQPTLVASSASEVWLREPMAKAPAASSTQAAASAQAAAAAARWGARPAAAERASTSQVSRRSVSGALREPSPAHILAMSLSTRSSWARKGSLQSTVRWAWSLSLRWTQSTV
jgi:hypothetical protein